MSQGKYSQKEEIEIEETSGEDQVQITKPFDPSEIRITTKSEVLQNIIERLKYNEINIFTEFQRMNDLWDEGDQSRLIESILLKLPLPAFYFDGEDNNRWDVVDGLQRINTIQEFVIDKKLALTNLEFLNHLEGMKYDDLTRDLQRRIKEFQITIYIIEDGTPDDVKYNIFKRINTGGLVLEPQEIRHALNQGIPANYIAELAKLNAFKKATDNKVRQKRMQDREFINRFVAFYLQGYTNYEPDLDSFLSKGMALIKKLSDEERQSLKHNFIQSMTLARTVFGNDAFRKRLNKQDRRKPINKALFDAISVCFASLTDNQTLILKKKKNIFRDYLIEEMHDSDFYDALSHGTSRKRSVITRFETIIDIIKKTTDNDFEFIHPKF